MREDRVDILRRDLQRALDALQSLRQTPGIAKKAGAQGEDRDGQLVAGFAGAFEYFERARFVAGFRERSRERVGQQGVVRSEAQTLTRQLATIDVSLFFDRSPRAARKIGRRLWGYCVFGFDECGNLAGSSAFAQQRFERIEHVSRSRSQRSRRL